MTADECEESLQRIRSARAKRKERSVSKEEKEELKSLLRYRWFDYEFGETAVTNIADFEVKTCGGFARKRKRNSTKYTRWEYYVIVDNS